jgi:hypothetical protein
MSAILKSSTVAASNQANSKSCPKLNQIKFKSNQIKFNSNHINSNQFKSNQIKSSQIKFCSSSSIFVSLRCCDDGAQPFDLCWFSQIDPTL